jgi:hypothetical protein
MRIELYEPLDNQTLTDALGLVGARVSDAAIALWTRLERALAFDWAIREHLAASDNNVIRRRDKPSFVTAAEIPGS